MPVWPICFCSCWPMPPDPMRLPAARMPMSAMETPASARAAMAAWAPRSTVSRSGCLPNLVMLIPRIQMSSLISRSSRRDRREAETDRLDTAVVGAHRIGGQADLHAERHVLVVGGHVDQVAPHARAVAVDHRSHVRHRDA